MFQQPGISPKVIPGPPIFDTKSISKLIAQQGSSSSTLSSVFGTLTGSSGNSSSSNLFNGTISTTQLYSENAHKMKKFRERSHFGPNMMYAYCCQNFVMIADCDSMQWIQSLDGHKHSTTTVQWCLLSKDKGIQTRGNSSILASADKSGLIIIWEIKNAKIIGVFKEDSGDKKSILSLKWMNDDNHFLLSLSAGGILSMWNVQTKSRVWKKDLSFSPMSISFNPFYRTNASLTTENGMIYFINDLNTSRAPELIERRLEVKPVKDKQGNMVSTLRDFTFSPHARNQVYLITRREVSLYDIDSKQTIAGKSFGTGKSDFRRILVSESNPDILYTLHEDGSVAAWEFSHEHKKFQATYCDVVRGSKHGADRPGLLYAVSRSQEKPNMLTSVSADGKVWTWEFYSPDNNPKTSKWFLRGLLETTSSTVCSMQASPFDKEIAVGTGAGTLLVYDLTTSQLKVKHDMFNSPVKGIRWFSRHQVICFSTKSTGSGMYMNYLVLVNLLTGQHTYLRKDKEKDDSYLRGIRLSDSKNYLIVIPKDKNVEIWSLVPYPKIIRVITIPSITAIEWCPFFDSSSKNEHFYFTSSDGTLHFYHIDQTQQVIEDKKQKIFSYNQVCALAWKANYLVSGDSIGNIYVLEVGKQPRMIQTQRGLIRKITFSPKDLHILVLFTDGDFSIYDVVHGMRTAHSSSSVKVDCVDWTVTGIPIATSNTGSILVFDETLSFTNSTISFRQLEEPALSPNILPNTMSNFLRSMLDDSVAIPEVQIEGSNQFRNCFGQIVSEEMKKKSWEEQNYLHASVIPEDFQLKLKQKDLSTAERCLLVARFFSDKTAVDFWVLAIKFLNEFKQKCDKGNDFSKDETKNEKLLVDHSKSNIEVDPSQYQDFIDTFDTTTYKSSLPAYLDLLRDNENVRLDEMALLKGLDNSLKHSQNPQSIYLYSQVAQNSALLGQNNTAVDLLMKTPPGHEQMYLNYLHAAVISAAHSKGHFHQTIELIASSLISSRVERDLMYGVEFLFLIGEGLKACKLLQDFDRWEKAARLAKSTLSEEKSKHILARWANHLVRCGNHTKAIGVWMSLGIFAEVLRLLFECEMYDIAALFARACEENGVTLSTRHSIVDDPTAAMYSNNTTTTTETKEDQSVEEQEKEIRVLLCNIYLKYADHLRSIKNYQLEGQYIQKAKEVKEKYKLDVDVGDTPIPVSNTPLENERQENIPPNTKEEAETQGATTPQEDQ